MQLFGLPVMFRSDVPWTLSLRKENNSFRVVLHKKTADGVFVATPEDDGTPCFLIYGPRATIKMRCESIDVANRALVTMYGSMPEITEILHTKEWAMVAAISGGEIPAKHRVIRNPGVLVRNPTKFNKEIFEAGLAPQPYDKGFERFVGTFDP